MSLWIYETCDSLHFGFMYILHSWRALNILTLAQSYGPLGAFWTDPLFPVSLYDCTMVWLCNDSNELSLSVHVFGVCETTGHQQAHQTHDTDIWYQYRTSEVKFLDSRQRLPLFILITQTIRIWPTSYWHTPPSWKQGPTGPTSILQPLVCCLPRTKALLSHLSDEITPMLVARWGDGRDPGPCRRRGSTWTHGVLQKRQGREGRFAEHMDACCWVSRRHLHRSTLALTLWP